MCSSGLYGVVLNRQLKCVVFIIEMKYINLNNQNYYSRKK